MEDKILGKITPCLWFDRQAEAAAEFYVSIFDDAEITHRNTSAMDWPGGAAGDIILVEFTLEGQLYQALNGGDTVQFNDAVSLSVSCKDQDEVDSTWAALLADGGEEIQCGWLKDKFGMRWQIMPRSFQQMLRDADPEQSKRIMAAMGEMIKLDMEKLRKAYEG